MTPSDIINKAVKAAFQSPKRIKEFVIDTPYGKANVRISAPEYLPKQTANKSKKENVWDKLLRYAGPAELSKGESGVARNHNKILYGKGGSIQKLVKEKKY